MLLRAYRYGADGFNVAHFAWLDALQPLPTASSYATLLLVSGLLAMTMAGMSPSMLNLQERRLRVERFYAASLSA